MAGPEVEIRDVGALANGVRVQAATALNADFGLFLLGYESFSYTVDILGNLVLGKLLAMQKLEDNA